MCARQARWRVKKILGLQSCRPTESGCGWLGFLFTLLLAIIRYKVGERMHLTVWAHALLDLLLLLVGRGLPRLLSVVVGLGLEVLL